MEETPINLGTTVNPAADCSPSHSAPLERAITREVEELERPESNSKELHSVCGFESILYECKYRFDTLLLGDMTPPFVGYPPENLPSDCNTTIFALTCDRSGDFESLAFTGKPAHVKISEVFIHSWDSRATYKATLSYGSRKVAVGVRRFDTHQVGFRTYVGISQTYFDVSTSLARFRNHIMDLLEFTDMLESPDFSSEEWCALRGLRFQENLVGLFEENPQANQGSFGGFFAEEIVVGQREKYTSDINFHPPSDQHIDCPIRLLLDAFTHWTLEQSGGTSVIGGFQGVGPIITEAVVHDIEHCWTIGNWGRSVISSFSQEHVCKKFCWLQGFGREQMSYGDSSSDANSSSNSTSDATSSVAAPDMDDMLN